MIGAHRVRMVLLAALLTLAALTGCVVVPTAGPIESVPGEAGACESCVNVEVAPPAAGAEPREVVEGYLRATSNYQPNYTTARQFLTRRSAETWQPEDGVVVYRATLAVSGDRVQLDGTRVGSLGSDRTYTADSEPLRVDFGLTQENGEWRIDRPPPGLMVAEYSFTRFYTGYARYFIGNGISLVPERIYLPALRNPPLVAAALMTALLEGPSAWLAPAVTSAIPAGTSLSVNSVTITDGIAEVALSDDVLALDDRLRSQLGAQIVYTLRQLSGVRGVLITVNQQKFRVPEADPANVIAVDAFTQLVDPVPFVNDQSYAVRDGAVAAVQTPDETPRLESIVGPLGRSGAGVDSLGVSVAGTDIAVATDGARALRQAPLDTGEVTTLLSGVQGLLRPQFSRYGETWAIGKQGGRQGLWIFDGTNRVKVDASALNGRAITAFRLSPDGVRVALVWRTDAGESELGLARIIRGDQVTVDQYRSINLRQTGADTQVTQIADVAWLDSDDLLLLGRATEDAPLVPVRVADDASVVNAEAGESGWNAEQISVLLRQQTVVAVGRDGQSWRNAGSRWQPFLSEVSAVAYRG